MSEAIRYIDVAPGLAWIEIPEADLRIQCGCPMDSIKHLTKRGLVAPRMVQDANGKSWYGETGPNAILLSDVMLQNGEFANLGEFPVLQMLYKQGLILPGHPKNTGAKPLLIGGAEPVNAQMQYIYRGNYGLVSKEEMIAAGASPEEAEQFMRIKLKFAFGAIRPTQDLLEGCVVGEGPTEIRNGVWITRTGLNKFEFRYGKDVANVDLNLSIGQHYASAYPLAFQAVPLDYFSVIHNGDGDGWDVDRPSMSSIVIFHGRIYLCDAGPNLQANLTSLGIGIDQVAGLFHTHAHDDHFAGITTLMRSGRRIEYFATPLVRASVAKKVAALLSIEEARFNEFFKVHDLKAGAWNDIDGLEVKPIHSPHPVETTIFQFRALGPHGYVTYGHYADIASFQVLDGMVTDDPSKPGMEREGVEAVKQAYLAALDVKKIDVGGGMIHGLAKDFAKDPSKRVILSHMARGLTVEEKEIGSAATHGAVDTLIDSYSDFSRHAAYAYLQSYFPNALHHQIRALLNNRIVTFIPGETLLKEGMVPDEALLILNGSVEVISTRRKLYGRLSSGAMVGEITAFRRAPETATYNAGCYVRTLAIPNAAYSEMVRKLNLGERLEKNRALRDFLVTTPIFSEGIPHAKLDAIAESVVRREVPEGEQLGCEDSETLNIIEEGSIQRVMGGLEVDRLGPGDHFGEEASVFGATCLFRMKAVENTVLLRIPGELLADVPIARWKLFEGYLKKVMEVVHSGSKHGLFRWNQAFNIQILEMDIHHKKLLEIANTIMAIIAGDRDAHALEKGFDALLHYTDYHFKAEEALMEQYSYPGINGHRQAHALLTRQVRIYRSETLRLSDFDKVDFKGFFMDWLVKHILSEDMKYSRFLHGKGIF
ncbi:MAG: bacteriohemerythrin [Magnetococcales bacterium]|nr:bacteriohemerythrin [Magnetococcales bacterium]